MFDINAVENPVRMLVYDDSEPEEHMEEVTRQTNKISIKNISSVNRCNTNDARRLCIFDSFYKFYMEGSYDIGGCYMDDKPDLWFYYTTTVCPEQVYLINLFVCHRRTGSFALGISNSNELSYQMLNDCKTAKLPDTLTWYRFQSSQEDQSHYVKTFSFNCQQKNNLQNTFLYIPVSITMQPTFSLNSELIESIKLEHNSMKISSLEREDFVLISANGTKYPVHKIIVAAHSTILREMMKESTSALHLDEVDNEVELLIQYVYTGIVKDISNRDIIKLFEIAHKYELTPLFNVTKYLIGKKIDVNNAVDVALLAKKYNLEELQAKVFDFIKKYPDVLNTEGWKKLNDVELAKSLFRHSQIKEENCL